MSEPVVAQKAPYPVDVEEGKNYFWCACGKSTKQPFCDGSHQDTEILPMKYTATDTRTVYFCGCKVTQNQPLCDGGHNAL
ncbi:MAG: glutamate synthase [Gammaproteobacteria bacterium]|jgi:CDGSH-type Zn-finger protein|nr:glutamate synthase [Gammaproteobacteria bacterium]|tara:strand:- start:73 stop:312 length:240 start_codon:yes stop_codon:yes gene_type:complete